VGQDKKSLGLLVWPNKEKLAETSITFKPNEDFNKNEKVKAYFMNMVKDIVSAQNGFKAFERISDMRFLPKPMEVGDELTNLYKMKRNVIIDKYKKLIDEMYD
jgi:long-chain acyl-CoA synthetase